MAEGRSPAGWVSAYKMSPIRKPYIFVEGCSDIWFWKKFIDTHSVLLQPVKGWKNVAACVGAFNENNINSGCIGIIDSDFESIHPNKGIDEDNIFLSDHHDIEMMMYESPAWEAALQAVDKKNRISESARNILLQAIFFTDKIGYLKLTALKHGIELHFKKHNKNREIELPEYEKKIMDKNGDYKGDEALINYIHAYSKNISDQPQTIPTVKAISDLYEVELKTSQDSLHLSNGHDLSYILSHILKKKYKNETSVDTIEVGLHSGYSFEFLRQTRLYEAIRNWAETNQISIFKSKLN